ncbi:MAG: hypothetical protein IKE46_10730 [Selenomonadaceae bacterium]|nr:hypothetical protein [Selenomonadaceae bacterium]
MDFAAIGTLSSYVKRKNLQFAAKHKIRTGQTLTNANGNFLSLNQTSVFKQMTESAKKSSDAAKQQKVRRIKQKLLAGQKLSAAEMGFLREADPKTYKKAKHAEDAREELKSELQQAKSKQEAREAVTRAMVRASAEAMAEISALGAGGGGSAVAGGNGAANVAPCGAENFSGDVSGDVQSAMNVSGEIKVSSEVKVSSDAASTENQTLSEVNQSIQATGKDATGKVSETTREEISAANDDEPADKFGNKKTSDADNSTAEDIMEKYLMTIRALEDEWARFAKSKEFKDLPDTLLDTAEEIHKQISAPNKKFLDAANAYRRSMSFAV